MRICSYRRTIPGTPRLPASVFPCLLGVLALALLLPSLAFAAPAGGYQFGQSQALDQAGVSVVRLSVTYTPANCSSAIGLGVIVASSSSGADSFTDWVLTDASLLYPTSPSFCGQSPDLGGIQLLASSTYTTNPAPLADLTCAKPDCLDNSSGQSVLCQPLSSLPPCKGGAALIPFTTPVPLPYVDVLNASPTLGIGLTTASGFSAIPQAVPASASFRLADRTPTAVTLSSIEAGMPLVNQQGQLVGMDIAGKANQSVAGFVSQQLNTLQHGDNPVHDAWDQAVSDFYTHHQSKVANDLQSMSQQNANFQAPAALEAAASSISNPRAATATPTLAPTAVPSNKMFGLPISGSLAFVGIVILVLLVIVLLVIGFVFLRRKTAIRREHEELIRRAEKQAAIDAPRIRQEEQAQAQAQASAQPGWDQWQQKNDLANAPTLVSAPPSAPAPPPQSSAAAPPLPVPQSPVAAVPPAATPQSPVSAAPVYQQSPALRCPQCGAPFRPGDNFCTQCRAALSPSNSGLHLRVVDPLAPPVSPESPTVQMSPERMQTVREQSPASIEAERTQPFPKQMLTPAPRHGRFVVATRSDRGYKRKYKPNEDSLFAAVGAQSPNSQFQDLGIFVVADGMGGHANGKDASHLAIQTIQERVLPTLQSSASMGEDDYIRLLKEGVQHANLAVHERNVEQHADMGTTMTAALIVDKVAYVANVGDSRTYLYRPSEGLKPITKDHSVVASLVAAGIINQEDVYNHPKRNQIYRSLGEKEEVEVDIFPVPLLPGDVLLLCCDGLWEMTRDHTIQSILQTMPDLSQAGQALIQAALDGGGDDNISIVLAKVEDVSPVDGTEAKHFEVLATPDKPQYPSMLNGADD
jgi:serine/threonine protein phosphatase PrpC